MDMSLCNKCGQVKPASQFYHDKNRKCGLTRWCISCMKEQNNEWKKESQDRVKTYMKEYREENHEKLLKQAKEYKKINADSVNKKAKEYKKKNIEKVRHWRKEYYKRNKNNPQLVLRNNLSRRISKALKGISRSQKTMELLGCDIKTFLTHIENKFTSDMSWDNYGKWHIDHIKPCAMFDLSDPIQQKQCFHYTNMQPLWQKDNCSKQARWIG